MDSGEGILVIVLTAIMVGAVAFLIGFDAGMGHGEDITRTACKEGESLVIENMIYECTPVYNTETREVIGG